MLRETDCIISLPTYKQYWIHTKSYGHDIVIWTDTGKVTIQCKWSDMERSNNNRVKKISEKSFIEKILKCRKTM
jgi:hypothetical protein